MSLCGAAVLKVMDQKTLDEVIRSVLLCIYEHLESLPERVHKSLTGNNLLPDTLFSLWGNKAQSQTSKTSESTASLSLAERSDDYRNLPTIEFCADLSPAHRCPFIKFKQD